MTRLANIIMSTKIAFNTSNLVARISDYRFELKHWGDQHKRTAAGMNEREWASICSEIAATGFKAVEIWQAHVDPEFMTAEKATVWRRILDEHGLEPISMGGGLSRENAQVCAWLNIPFISGGIHPKKEDGSPDIEAMRGLCHEFNIRFGFENHAEKSAEAILAHIEGSDDYLGVTVDTGWLGTQGLDAPSIIRELGIAVHHIHLKDVQEHGGHDTVELGSGVVDVEGCITACKEIGYSGWYSWEDEPEDRNPFDSAVQNRQWIEAHLA